jgi:hypothetical protein
MKAIKSLCDVMLRPPKALKLICKIKSDFLIYGKAFDMVVWRIIKFSKTEKYFDAKVRRIFSKR